MGQKVKRQNLQRRLSSVSIIHTLQKYFAIVGFLLAGTIDAREQTNLPKDRIRWRLARWKISVPVSSSPTDGIFVSVGWFYHGYVSRCIFFAKALSSCRAF